MPNRSSSGAVMTMASGVPMIASDLPVLQEVLRDEHNALIVPAADATAWQGAIRRLLADPQLRDRLATTARRELEDRYTARARAMRILTSIDGDASRRHAS